MKNLRFIVVHSPGPNWKPGVPAFEQDGLQLHVGHYATLLKPGKLLMGGPFMDGRDTNGSQSERCHRDTGSKNNCGDSAAAWPAASGGGVSQPHDLGRGHSPGLRRFIADCPVIDLAKFAHGAADGDGVCSGLWRSVCRD
jgi:hypothetical protein